MKWPSELPNRFTPVPELPWPSETWSDAQFGPRRQRAHAPAAAAVPSPRPTAAPAAPPSEAPAGAAGTVPSDDAVRASVASIGLVSTAQWVMSETGWDAKRVALHLRRVLNAR